MEHSKSDKWNLNRDDGDVVANAEKHLAPYYLSSRLNHFPAPAFVRIDTLKQA